jgi:hypothetical protein
MKNLILLLVAAATPVLRQELNAQTVEQRLLDSYSVDSIGQLRYQVLVGSCGEIFCQTRVSVGDTEGELDSLVWEDGLLANSMPQRVYIPEIVDDGCWRTQVMYPDAIFAVLCSRLVRLGRDWNGLILTYTAGIDLPGFKHHLVAVMGDTLAQLHIWGPNVGGPTFNLIRVGDVDGDGVEEIANVTGYAMPEHDPDLIDQWHVKTFGWDAELADLVDLSETQRAFRAYATILGSFETLAEAREYQDALDPCLPYYFQVLKSDDFPMLRPGWFILAQLTTDREQAFKLLEQTKECVAPAVGYVRRAQ